MFVLKIRGLSWKCQWHPLDRQGKQYLGKFVTIFVLYLVWWVFFFLRIPPAPPQETWFYLDQKKFRKSGQGRLTVKWGKMCVYRVVVIVVYALSFRLCVLGDWINKAVFWVANLLVNRVQKGRLVDAKLCWVKKRRGDIGDHWEAIPNRELLQVQVPEAGPATFFCFVACHSLPTFLTGVIVFFFTSLKLRSIINDL